MPPPQTSSLLTREVTDRIVDFIAGGATAEEVAAAEGIHRSTFMAWMQAGREAEEGEANDFVDLYERVVKARAQCRIRAEIVVRQRDPKFYLTHSPSMTADGGQAWVSSERNNVQVGVGMTVETLLTGAFDITGSDPLSMPDNEQGMSYLGEPSEAPDVS
jgi:hypothetical protein|tara:strand:+ start:64 stop:543 length:480 start_codon:yes stop_codon:yes gene_type:complete